MHIFCDLRGHILEELNLSEIQIENDKIGKVKVARNNYKSQIPSVGTNQEKVVNDVKNENLSNEDEENIIKSPMVGTIYLQPEPNSNPFIKIGDKVKKGQTFVQWDPYNVPILSEKGGKIVFHDIIEGVTMDHDVDPATGQESMVIIEHKEDLHPQVIIEDKSGHAVANYPIPAGAHITVGENDKIAPGTLLAKTPRKTSKTKDITGGLPRVSELFEARQPKDAAEIGSLSTVSYTHLTLPTKRIV